MSATLSVEGRQDCSVLYIAEGKVPFPSDVNP